MRGLAPHEPLPPGTQVDDYTIQSRLGKPGGFGVTYSALRGRDQRKVAIKELFPTTYVVRLPSGKIAPKDPAEATIFREAQRIFRREAEILSRVRHENVVRVIDYLETMGTGYIVMRYEEGYDLSRHLELQRPNRPNETELLRMLMPLLDGLSAVHRLDYLHRDIKPSNIYLTRDHKPMLIDFGSSKSNLGKKSGNVMVSEGYSPYELYFTDSGDGREGPYTDIYSLGTVLHTAMLRGEPFPSALTRAKRDPVVPLTTRLRNQEYSQPFLEAVDWALRPRGADRPQSVEEWRKALARGIGYRIPRGGPTSLQVTISHGLLDLRDRVVPFSAAFRFDSQRKQASLICFLLIAVIIAVIAVIAVT
jgi:serine/threonine protein kinase